MLQNSYLFFKSRGFNESTPNKTAKEIANNPRSNFLHHNHNSLTQEPKQSRNSERIPFVTNWTDKFSGFQRILQYHYNEMVNEFPNLKCVFPKPPILSYRRNHNLRNLLVRSRFTPPSSNRPTSNSLPCLSKRGKGCKLCHSMSNTILSQIFNLVKLASLQEADVIQVTQFMQQSVQNIS